MRKQTIGKFQLAIGIILLIVGIVGVIYGISQFKEIMEIPGQITNLEDSEYKAQGIAMLIEMMGMKTTISFVMVSSSIILIFLSLLFITQGLVNKAEN